MSGLLLFALACATWFFGAVAVRAGQMMDWHGYNWDVGRRERLQGWAFFWTACCIGAAATFGWMLHAQFGGPNG